MTGPVPIGPGMISPVPIGPGMIGPVPIGPGMIHPGTIGPGMIGPVTIGPGMIGPVPIGPGMIGPVTIGPLIVISPIAAIRRTVVLRPTISLVLTQHSGHEPPQPRQSAPTSSPGTLGDPGRHRRRHKAVALSSGAGLPPPATAGTVHGGQQPAGRLITGPAIPGSGPVPQPEHPR